MSFQKKNSSPMQLRSQMRQQLTHSGRDFVINGGHIEQAALRNKDSVCIDTSDVDNEFSQPHFRISPRVVVFCGVLVIFQIMCFLAWKSGQSAGNDL